MAEHSSSNDDDNEQQRTFGFCANTILGYILRLNVRIMVAGKVFSLSFTLHAECLKFMIRNHVIQELISS